MSLLTSIRLNCLQASLTLTLTKITNSFSASLITTFLIMVIFSWLFFYLFSLLLLSCHSILNLEVTQMPPLLYRHAIFYTRVSGLSKCLQHPALNSCPSTITRYGWTLIQFSCNPLAVMVFSSTLRKPFQMGLSMAFLCHLATNSLQPECELTGH